MMMESGDTATLPMAVSNVRPNSLVMAPEKEPITFHTNLVGAPSEVEQLIEHIKSVAEQFLYHWKTFPLNLPTPLVNSLPQATVHTQLGTNRKARPINLRDLFIAPSFDELDLVAADNNGEPRRLTNTQLRGIRDRGEFEVPSLNFEGQFHRWRLSQFLQKGCDRTQDSLLGDLALAARFLVVTARGRILGHFFSVSHAIRALWIGFVKLIDMLVGVPSLLAQDLDNKIKEERCKFLIAELVCRPEHEDCLDALCSYVKQQLKRATMEKFDVECDQAQPIPYLYLTPKGQQIDLRLFSKDIMRKSLPTLVGILEKETRGWFLHFRERLIAELREKKLSDQEIEEQVNEAVNTEYLQRVYTSILSNQDICGLGESIPQLLVQQAQSVVIMHKSVEKVQKELAKSRENFRKNLTEAHPVLSRLAPWLRSKLEAAEHTKVSKSVWTAHEEAIKMCLKHNLQQTVYFLNRDLTFMRDREPILLKELKNAKTPTRNFVFACRIWSPKNWIIRRSFQGYSEIIPTVISQQATSIVTPRSDPSQPIFLVEKEILRTTSTRWPLWRLLNLFQRTWTWTWNIMFLFGVVVPFESPLGLRALFSIKPFMPDLELSQVNGTLFPRKTSITPTTGSRLVALWRHISKSRTHFESEPDTGFIGKGLTRHLNRLWNYIIKGFLGTLLIIFMFPLLCLLVSATSILFALTAPLWMPMVTLLMHAFMILVYDMDSPDDTRNRYCILFEAVVWNGFMQGLVQPVAAVVVSGFICPLVSVLVLVVGISRYWMRLFWDAAVFHLFIKKCGRVPASDSIAVKRIAGPGLLEHYLVIKPESALCAFEAKMELDELQAYQHSIETIICQPQKDFSAFVEACFGPFSAQLSKSGPYRQLERECQDLMSSLHEKLEKRRKDLQTGLTTAVKSKIKLNTNELKIAIQQAAYMLERFYPTHVISRLSMAEEEFWDVKGLSVGDWPGLAALLYSDIFSLDFLTPLCDADTKFKLEPHNNLDLSRYTELVQNSYDVTGTNAPDLLGNVYTPRGNIQVHSPYLEVAAFNPRSRISTTRKPDDGDAAAYSVSTPRGRAARKMQAQNASAANSSKRHCVAAAFSWRPWKRKAKAHNPAEKMQIPLPIPHPVHIAISIYNRDSDQPIILDSDMSFDILRSIEECHGDLQATNVSRYRGGGTTDDDGSGSRVGGGIFDSSNDSLGSQSSGDTRDSLEIAGGTETLPMANRVVDAVEPEMSTLTNIINSASSQQTIQPQETAATTWTLSNWGANPNRRNNGTETVRVELASPEDISLDTDSRNFYGTTV